MIVFIADSCSVHPTVQFSMEDARKFLRENAKGFSTHNIFWNTKEDGVTTGEAGIGNNDRILIGKIYTQNLTKEKWAAATLMDQLGGEGELDIIMRLVDEFMKGNRGVRKRMLGEVGAHRLNPYAQYYLLDRYYDLILG